MAFNTNLLKSNTAKQIAGGLGGMAIAGLLYLAVDQASYLSIKGLLVSTNTISEKAGQVNVNTTNIDEDTKRQLAKNANAVAGQLQSSASAASSSQIAETPVGNNVAERRAKRIFANEVSQAFQSAPTYSNDPNVFVPVEQRVAIRAARIANLPAPDFAPQPLGVGEGAPAMQAAAPVTVVDPGATTLPQGQHAAPTAHSSNLPNSGLGLNLLVLASVLCAFLSVKTGLRDRLVALVA